jgi:hypothetical protein
MITHQWFEIKSSLASTFPVTISLCIYGSPAYSYISWFKSLTKVVYLWEGILWY